MSEKLTLDDGVIELDINGNGLLRFNPADPNVYQRFLTLARELPGLEAKYTTECEAAGDEESEESDDLNRAGAVLDGMHAMDADVKARLSAVFGRDNDFDRLLGGVNLMAPGRNGQRVITNLLEALSPYLEDGVKRYRQEAAEEAVLEAKKNRAQRRAK